jgi:putative transposase
MLWQIASGYKRENVEGALFSFTGHEFKKYLHTVDPQKMLQHFVNDSDRTFQFWEREPMVKECWSYNFFLQKLDYIHFNPCQPRWNLARTPEEYYWSSAAFYELGDTTFNWLSHYED